MTNIYNARNLIFLRILQSLLELFIAFILFEFLFNKLDQYYYFSDFLVEWINRIIFVGAETGLTSKHNVIYLSSICSVFAVILINSVNKNTSYTCKIGNLYWDRNAFCRGWLITGSTGSGKTLSGINILMHEVFKNEKGIYDEKDNYFLEHPWGGLCIDEKGLYWQTLQEMAEHYKRKQDLILLQTRPNYVEKNWKPIFRLNLLSDNKIPANTYASAIVNTASSISGSNGDKGFFKTQSESNIGWAIELFRNIRDFQKQLNLPEKCYSRLSLKSILEILTNRSSYDELIEMVESASPTLLINPKLYECLNHFKNRYWNQPKEQLGGVQGTIYNYLNYFTNDDVAEVFCSDNTFNFEEIERGKIICIAMPQKLQIERRYVCTLLKLLFYTQVLRRFDMQQNAFKRKNLLICWQDEAQRFITEADGNVDVIREAGATTILACQSKTSLYPPLGGKEKANVTILNLRNRIIFRASDEDCAVSSAEFIGKKQTTKKTKSISRSGVSYSYSKADAFKIQPHELRELKDFCGIIYHSSGKFKRYMIAPKDSKGITPKWWYKKMPLRIRLLLVLISAKIL